MDFAQHHNIQEKDDTAYVLILRLIGLLCGFCTYFGFSIAFNIYSLHISSDTNEYDEFGIILFCIAEKFVLYLTLSLYVLPRSDNYLSVNPNILRSLNINTASIKKKTSSFKDPNASDKWAFHGDEVNEYNDEECDLESNVSYTTLMYRDQQKQKQATKHWFSYFMPSPSPSQNREINAGNKKKRFSSQAQVGGDNIDGSLQSIQSMYSD